ncbi:asparaginase [Amycolatopsis sp. SID8362]|uniref:asparaginase n=1 Tax=Amycolatopsis sp. SID8362 TaxID=2690346 RepID=UPI00136F829F|nr:asparaginase [Amycolatopsis sp. SID8362]NBH07140.1 asparaginase [Amycolatopsis sp. SID8362]NED43836.1 asparaginase [Amycolatopsis sp. SID8362]
MTNPVLAEVVRSGFVESVHRGALVVTGPEGEARLVLGDVTSPVYPRSSNKPLQAVGMLRAGLDFDGEDLALACASHSGEPGHVKRVLELLEAAGLREDDLACPPDFPLHVPSMRDAAEPRRVMMNCSGKHTAMLTTCLRAGWPTSGYEAPDHPLQQKIAAAVAELTGEPIAHTGVDGCGAPLFAFSLTGLARAFGRLAVAPDGPESRVATAMRTHPWLVGGTGREDTDLMSAVDGLVSKAGAEGVHAFAFPDGFAVAIKIDDGNKRACAPLAVAALRYLGVDVSTLPELAHGSILGGGRPVGEILVPELRG